MKAAALAVLLVAIPCFAKARQWQDATVVQIVYSNSDNGAAVVPVGNVLYGLRIRSTVINYQIDTANMKYLLGQVIAGRKRPLNITLHGHTKIAIEGQDAHILDDSGKDVKLPIVEKAAK